MDARVIGDFTLQDAVFYSAQLQLAFQATSLVWGELEEFDIGLNKTFTGQIFQKLQSSMVGEHQRPIFQVPEIVIYDATVNTFECPVFLSDTSTSAIRFAGSVMSSIHVNIGMELGRRADRVVISALNAKYDTSSVVSIPTGTYFDVRAVSQCRALLGARSARGRLITLIDHIQYSNLELDDRFSRWNFNEARPLTWDAGEPFQNNRFVYGGITYLKLPDGIGLPKSSATRTRMFMLTRDSVRCIRGAVSPYNGSVMQQFQVHRGGTDFNCRIRLGCDVPYPEGILAIEADDSLAPRN
jgi:hypothetical protein